MYDIVLMPREFLSTLSLRRATRKAFLIFSPIRISIHALLAESDGISLTHIIGFLEFLSTLSLRRATTTKKVSSTRLYVFLSTLSLRRATQVFQRIAKPFRISIHALLAESDTLHLVIFGSNCNFYPRSPCGERPDSLTDDVSTGGFLSTLSLRRATTVHNAEINKLNDFYPRSPCGERPRLASIFSDGAKISIHALLAESDFTMIITTCIVLRFLSTLSLRRATRKSQSSGTGIRISIHALLAESDSPQLIYLYAT